MREKSAVTLAHAGGPQPLLVKLPKPPANPPAAVTPLEVEVEMGGVLRMGRLLPITGGQQPADKAPASRVASVAAGHEVKEHFADGDEAALDQEMVKVRPDGTEEITND